MSITRREARDPTRVGSYNELRFISLRRIWWRVRYRWATCRVDGAGTSRIFHFGNPTSKRHLQTLYGEAGFFHAFLAELSVGDVVWDIGAAFGLYSVFAAHLVGTSGRVCVFEPLKNRLNEARKNARLNKSSNLIFLQMALSNESCHGSMKGEEVAKKPSGSIIIETGDNLLAKGTIPFPNALKIDVEGGEWDVLNGMSGILKSSDCRLLAMEIHPRRLGERNPADIEKILSDCGFSIVSRTTRGSEQHWVAIK